MWSLLGLSVIGMAAAGAALGAIMGLTGLLILKFFANGATDHAMYATWDIMNSFTFSAVPMYILLGDVLVASGISKRIYSAISPLFERVPGGLLQSNVAVSAVFGAVSGSSAATSAAVGTVAYAELAKRRYHLPSVAASLAAGGTLGLLIPPSLSLLIFGAWQDVSIGKLFIAGVLPGLLMAFLFMLWIGFDAYRRPQLIPKDTVQRPWRLVFLGLLRLWPMVILLGAVLGTIYFGLTTVTEAAGLGVFAAVLLGFFAGELTFKGLLNAVLNSTVTYAALCFILIGAAILSASVTLLGLPRDIAAMAATWGLTKYWVLIFVVIFYLLMGIVFDGISLMLVTVPFIYPMMASAGFDPVWIGIFVTIMIEIGMLTPPIGVNLFVIIAISKNMVALRELSVECLPYWIMLLVGTALITVFPDIVLWLPRLAY